MLMKLRTLSSSLYARMALILLAGLLVAQGVSIWLQSGERAKVVSQARGLNFVDRVAESIRVLEASAPSQRATALSALQYGGVHTALINDDQVSRNAPRGSIQAKISTELGSPREIHPVGALSGTGMQHGNQQRGFDVRLLDGQWIRITAGGKVDAAVPALPNSLIIQLLITLGIVTTVVMIAVRQATRPLQQLAQAADTLGRDLDAPPLTEEGSVETRRAAQAFNRMQTKIKRLVNERASALAAVSHDLRTPLTRLRLRTELVDDVQLRDQMASDLESMAAMLDATLDYLRGLQSNEVVRPIDINALLGSMVEDALVIGRVISIEGSALAPYNGRLSALQRALQNLIDNAIKYGQGARIFVEDSATLLCISVHDEGPGIPSTELTRVKEPYYRVDAARSFETGGVGLGLSIVNDIAFMHGGELQIANRPQGGLSATLILPRS